MANQQNQKPNLTVWVVWGAMFGTLFIYLLMLHVFIGNAENFEAPDPQFVSTMRLAFGAIALSEIGAIFVLRKMTFFRKLDGGDFTNEKQMQGAYFTTCIMTWALIESIAIYGFVLAFMTHNIVYYLAFAAVSLVLYPIFRPQLARYKEEFAEQQQAAREAADRAQESNDDDSAVW